MSYRPKFAVLIASIWSVILLAGASIPGVALHSVEIFTYDKLWHTFGFALFAFLWLRCFPKHLLQIGLAGAMFGILIEIYQHVMPIGRFFDLYDALADFAGLGLGTGLFLIAQSFRLNETPESKEQL